MTLKIAVMASTKGTDLQAILDAIKDERLDAVLKLVFANKECFAVERAQNHGIRTVVIEYNKKTDTREKYDKRVAKILDKEDIDLIVLVGYMRLFSGWFCDKYKNRILNIHPSILPSFPGMDRSVHEDVLNYGCKVSGVTIHFVDEGMDTGPIMMQGIVGIDNDETIDSLKEKVQNLEKKMYPKAIQMFAEGRVSFEGRKVIIND